MTTNAKKCVIQKKKNYENEWKYFEEKKIKLKFPNNFKPRFDVCFYCCCYLKDKRAPVMMWVPNVCMCALTHTQICRVGRAVFQETLSASQIKSTNQRRTRRDRTLVNKGAVWAN